MSYVLVLNGNGTSSLVHSDEDGLYLAHHGIKGQRWGVRRFQNSDGSLKPMGRNRYAKTLNKLDDEGTKYASKYMKNDYKAAQLDVKKKRYAASNNKAKVDKITKKQDSLRKKAESSYKQYNDNRKVIDKMIKAAGDQGYKVYAMDGIKTTTSSYSKVVKDRQKYGPKYSATAVNSRGEKVTVYQTPSEVLGRKYKVFI